MKLFCMERFFTNYLRRLPISLVFQAIIILFLGVGFVSAQKAVRGNVTDKITGEPLIGGWDSDLNMAYDYAKDEWVITPGLKAEDLKFRANDAWGMNFGDNGANGSLKYDGANIAIAAEGNYEIWLNLSTPFYTYKITKKK